MPLGIIDGDKMVMDHNYHAFEHGHQKKPPVSRSRSNFSPFVIKRETAMSDHHNQNPSSNTTLENIYSTQTIPRNQPMEQRDDSDAKLHRPRAKSIAMQPNGPDMLTPPSTPIRANHRHGNDSPVIDEIISYDFNKTDYEIDRTRVLGKGLWSTVYLAHAMPSKTLKNGLDTNRWTPPSSPVMEARPELVAMLAIKTMTRPDAKAVFEQEARMLTHLQRQCNAQSYIIPFLGYDFGKSALVFEAGVGGSLGNLLDRLRQMTEVARHLEVINILPNLALHLAEGLAFIHAAGVVHADIKPDNILIDIFEPEWPAQPVMRPRFIDFSASFKLGQCDQMGNGGGTWDYMAPEQMFARRDLNSPTPASDVWALAISLLTVIVGGSPFRAACGDNMFLLREAVKCGDPLKFARNDRKVQKRIATCQSLIDVLMLGLQKERDKRITASAWSACFMSHH